MGMTTPVFRFAPSPNGLLHLGHALSALVNFDMARAAGGCLLLRIEDIDHTRCRPEYEAAIYEDLTWLGIEWEEPVRRQSEHFDEYRAALDKLCVMRLTFPSFESRAELAHLVADRESHAREPRDPDGAPLYPGTARLMSDDERQARIASGAPYAIRLDMTTAQEWAGSLRWTETGAGPGGEHGSIAAAPEAWGDVVLGRKETPTSYHLSVVIDDALQGVTHVVRGQDLFWSTSVHRLLQALLNLPMPVYHHHRLIPDADGKKLSKSTNATGLRELRAQGMSSQRYSQAGRPRRVAPQSAPCHLDRGRRAGGPVPSRRKKKPGPLRRTKARPRATSLGSGPTELALANLAHDIRTPLTGMLAMSELLVASDLPERERRWAAAIRDAAGHLARLTTLVVDAAKAGSSKLVLQTEPFALRELVEAVAQSLAARADGKSLETEISIAKTLPARAIGDAVRLRSALENLIDNAVKFTERGRVSLTVTTARAPRDRLRLRFAVADTGIGIVAADLKRLFRPFVQANASIARRFGGAGLGLAFVKRIAQSMGGSLEVKSRPGRGSTFVLTVLIEQAPPMAKAGAPRDAPAGLHVLCVEDNPYGRVVLNTVLTEIGHRTSFVGSGEAALAALERERHDVVLLDVALPGIDGFETARRIRALPGPPGLIPIIGVSGRTDTSDEAAARAAGMDGYLHKPLSPQQLDAALADAVAAPVRYRQEAG